MIIINLYIYHKNNNMAKNELYSNVTRLLRSKHMQQKDLAAMMGCAPAVLSKALSGNPTLDTIRKIAKALDVSIKSLFEDSWRTEGFITYKGRILRFNSRDELIKIIKN